MINPVTEYALLETGDIVEVKEISLSWGYEIKFINGTKGIYGKALLKFIPNEIAYLYLMGDRYV
jgi:hypothetical protein